MKRVIFLAIISLVFLSCSDSIEPAKEITEVNTSASDMFIIKNLDSLPDNAYHLCAIVGDKVYILPAKDTDPKVIIVQKINVPLTVALILGCIICFILIVLGITYFVHA